MLLKELIAHLEEKDATLVPPFVLDGPHSHRGSYEQLAFHPVRNQWRHSVGDQLKLVKEQIGAMHCGWKGGDFRMDGDSDVHLAESGRCGVECTPDMIDLLYEVMEAP